MKYVPYLILGAGPAGIQLSYLLTRVGIEHVILERNASPGSFFKAYPRHRKLLSINKVYTGTEDPELNLRWDWNSLLSEDGGPLMSDFSKMYFPNADDLVAYLEAFVEHHQIAIEYGFSATRIARDSETRRFIVTADDGRSYSADHLIVATGVPKTYSPKFPGVELCESYADVSVHPQSFVNQRVLIMGKGNSAFETADNLVHTAASIHLASPTPLRMAWRTHFVGHLRAVNNNILDTYQLKGQNAILDAEVVGIRKEGSTYAVDFQYAHAHGEIETLRYDRVILCTGFMFDASAFDDSCKPALTDCGRLPKMTSEWESENVPDMFFAGTLMQYRDYKRYMSSFIHGFRYNVRALVRMLEARYHETPWPARAVASSDVALSEVLLKRMNRSSAIWQQPGFLADVVRLDAGPSSAEYYEELPLDYALEHHLNDGEWLTLTLEYGKTKALDPFHVERVHRHDTKNAADSAFLHPIVRHYIDGQLTAEHHVLEDLAAVWEEPEHVLPLREFLAGLPGTNSASTREARVHHSGVVQKPEVAEDTDGVASERALGLTKVG